MPLFVYIIIGLLAVLFGIIIYLKLRKPLILSKIIKNVIIFLEFVVLVIAWALYIGLHLLPILNLWFIFIYLIYPIVWIYFYLQGNKLKKHGQSNIIVFGGKGSGKSLLFQKLIIMESNRPLSNIDFGYNDIVNPHTYFQSIAPNDSKKMITNKLVIVNKNPLWEKRNYYFDDTNMFASNTEDAFLKQYFTSMNLFILGQRHFYDSCTILNAQSLDRIYKNLRELQLDGYISVQYQIGFNSRLISSLPIFKKYVFINYIYYKNYETARMGKLPYKEVAFLDKMMSAAHVGSGRALEKIYNAENGKIYRSTVVLKKKSLKYDTRVYHQWLFGFKVSDEK